MFRKTTAGLIVSLGLALAAPVFGATDATVDQVYSALRAGHLTEAQQMIEQVLRDYPKSGKAHFIAAEVYAKAGNVPMARMQLNTAESLAPGLPFEPPASVRALESELAGARGVRGVGPGGYVQVEPHRTAFPLGGILLLVGAILVIWFIVRRRFAPPSASQYPPVGNPNSPGYGPYPGYGAPMGGGIGSGIAGGLASGLAVGAGVVAGEELAHRFLDGDRGGGVIPAAGAGELERDPNADMGGNDFGVSDPGSWDDGGGGDMGGGGGDWT
jgi:hypothetical protein